MESDLNLTKKPAETTTAYDSALRQLMQILRTKATDNLKQLEELWDSINHHHAPTTQAANTASNRNTLKIEAARTSPTPSSSSQSAITSMSSDNSNDSTSSSSTSSNVNFILFVIYKFKRLCTHSIFFKSKASQQNLIFKFNLVKARLF